MSREKNIRVLYSFPNRLGAGRVCYTAWQQVIGLAKCGADVKVCASSISKPLPQHAEAWPTLAWGKFRVPYKLIGSMRAFALHDRIVSRRIEKMAGKIDIIHTWPLGSLRTLKTAARLGIPTVMERPNAHTRFAYEAVQNECKKLGVDLPSNHEHAYKADVLRIEEQEYALATRLLCPSDFVAKTFIDRGFAQENLLHHQYGFDERAFLPGDQGRSEGQGLKVLFVGGCAPRKGVHYALEAWLKSTACENGTLTIAGAFVPGYAERLSSMLSHPSVKVLGHRTDVAELMKVSDILILPSIEEGSALVTYEARGSGCVLVVSDAAGAICHHMEDGLVHHAGDVGSLAEHLNMLNNDRALLQQLRATSLKSIPQLTWIAAAEKLINCYRQTLEMHSHQRSERNEFAAKVQA